MILAILQARMTSRRLPGKTMRSILGQPMIGLHIERIRRSDRIDKLVLATSTDESDEPIAQYCGNLGVPVYRGSLEDVLGRYRGAAVHFGPADHIVRLTADCPLADWEIIDECIDLHLEGKVDYTSNVIVRTYPDGLDVEVMTSEALARCFRDAVLPAEREHVTPYIRNHSEIFSQQHVVQSPNLGHLRWTVDTPADFAMVTAVYEALYPTNPAFLQKDILNLLKDSPDIGAINDSVGGS